MPRRSLTAAGIATNSIVIAMKPGTTSNMKPTPVITDTAKLTPIAGSTDARPLPTACENGTCWPLIARVAL